MDAVGDEVNVPLPAMGEVNSGSEYSAKRVGVSFLTYLCPFTLVLPAAPAKSSCE